MVLDDDRVFGKFSIWESAWTEGNRRTALAHGAEKGNRTPDIKRSFQREQRNT